MISKKMVALLLLINATITINAVGQNFIIKKKAADSPANLSKDAIKERMGDAVRDGLHLLFDNAADLVTLQKNHTKLAQETCTVHEKIIELQRRFSRIAESLIENHFTYKKNHKKRLETSLALLQECTVTFKQTDEQLKSATNTKNLLATITSTLTAVNNKISTDTCLKGI